MSTVRPADDAAYAEAVARLAADRLVAFPTETVYGLGAAAASDAAVARVFAAKGRPADHPLIVHLATADALGDWADPLPAVARALTDAFWPGPLTLVLPAAAHVSRRVTGGQATVAVRQPDHPVAAALLTRFGGALVAPSANRFGHVSPTRAAHVAAEFADDDVLVLDGGPCRVGVESTILDLTADAPRILRPGAVTAADLAGVLGPRAPHATSDATPDGPSDGPPPGRAGAAGDADAPRVPGALPSHYAPRARAASLPPDAVAAALEADPGAVALVRAAVLPPHLAARAERLPEDPAGYAHRFYDAVRRLDAGRPSVLWIETPPAGEAWAAIRDRVARATA